MGNEKGETIVMEVRDAREAFNMLLWETRTFVKNIIGESVNDPEKYSMRLEVSEKSVKVLVYNGDTGEIVGQHYDIDRFLRLCKEKKIEFQLNNDVRKLVLQSQDKTGRKMRWN